MSYKDLDPKNLAGTPTQQPSVTTNSKPAKKDCLNDVIGNFFNDVKGALTGIVKDAVDVVKGAINDVHAIVTGIGEMLSCIDLEFKLEKISIKGILDDIKKGIEDGINDAINFGKGIIDAAKEARAFLTCQKGTAYEQEAETVDNQLLKAGDEDSASGEAMTKSNFTSNRSGTDVPMSPRRRRDVSNGNASGRGFVDSQVSAGAASTLDSVKNNARGECGNNNSKRNPIGMTDVLNVTNYG